MDVSSVSQGGLSTSGLSQTINSNESKVANGNDSLKSNQNKSENNNVDGKSSITEKQIKNVVEKMNKLMSGDGTHVEYELHKGILNAVVKIIDNSTNVVVKQIPAQRVVDAMENLYNSIGMILDKKA